MVFPRGLLWPLSRLYDYRSGAAPCKNDQKMIIFDFETLFLGQKIELGVTKSTIRFALLLRVEMY